MTEFTQGISNTFKGLMKTSLGLAIIYTLGHICIAMIVVSVVTGASFWESGVVALIEPAINGVWFYSLHKIYTLVNKEKNKKFGVSPGEQKSKTKLMDDIL